MPTQGSLKAHHFLLHLSYPFDLLENTTGVILLKSLAVEPRGLVVDLTLYCSLDYGVVVSGSCDLGHLANVRPSLLPPVPKVVTLGKRVAPFSLPPEARPTDPVRRELFRQQASKQSAWFAPNQASLDIGPLPLPYPSSNAGPLPLPAPKRRRR